MVLFEDSWSNFSQSWKIFVSGQQQCRDMSKLFILSDCQAYSYIVRKEAALQARIDAAITTVDLYHPISTIILSFLRKF